ncbi:MAG TPA: PAS domain S-box protein, partial [Gemmatimonadaceae bacterium]|nr:PAS domain S-box protein [Gemmatimonadaceae bacterium]
MPLTANRSVTAALWIALVAAATGAGMALAALWRGAIPPNERPLVGAALFVCAAGAVAYALVRTHTVGRRVRALQDVEHDLRISEANFAGILDIAADAIITVDDAQRIVHFNTGAEQIFGYSRSEMIGQPLERLIPERFRAAHVGHMRRFAAGTETARRMGERREIFGLRRGEIEFPAEASISRLATATGVLFTVVLRDITERKRVEHEQRFLAALGEELARSLDEDATAQLAVGVAVPGLADACVLDLVHGDTATRRLVSDGGPERVRAPLAVLAAAGPLGPDSPSRVIDVLRTRRSELVANITEEWLEAHTDDAPLVAAAWRALGARSLMIVPLVTREHLLGAVTLMALDGRRLYEPTDLVFAEEIARRLALALDNARLYHAARTATRARDEVLGIVSHDLQNPIAAIAMGASVLRDQPPGDVEGRRQLLRMITESTEWMRRLIRDLLDVSAIEAGRLSVDRRGEAPAPIVASATRMLASSLAERSIDLRVAVSDDLPLVDVDASRIEQVLVNLLGNAIKFTSPGGRITIRAAMHGTDLEMSVADSGIGIAPDEQTHVFERYWQARHT